MEHEMKRVILSVAMVAGLGFTATADEPKGDKQQATAKALETFSGTWEIVKVSPDGATKDAKRLVFNKNGTYAAVDKDGKELWAGTFEIDPTATPKVWDHRSDDGKKKGDDVLGIYELDGDALKVACVVGRRKGKEWVGKVRPTTFDPTAADVVIEMKRAKTSK
jgi:uncharacterized protein (TIGR03067 family)